MYFALPICNAVRESTLWVVHVEKVVAVTAINQPQNSNPRCVGVVDRGESFLALVLDYSVKFYDSASNGMIVHTDNIIKSPEGGLLTV